MIITIGFIILIITSTIAYKTKDHTDAGGQLVFTLSFGVSLIYLVLYLCWIFTKVL